MEYFLILSFLLTKVKIIFHETVPQNLIALILKIASVFAAMNLFLMINVIWIILIVQISI